MKRNVDVLPSNHSFGVLFTLVFALVGAWSWLRGGTYAMLLFAASAAVLAVTLLKPQALAPFNRAWMTLARVLHRVVSPVVLGIVYFGLITPFALVMRLFRPDVLERRLDPQARSYWKAAGARPQDPKSFEDPF